ARPHPPGTAQECVRLAAAPPAIHEPPARRELHDAVVAGVGDVHEPVVIHRDALRLVQPRVSTRGLPELCERLTGRRELLNAAIARVGHVEVALPVERDRGWPGEPAGRVAGSAPDAERLADRREL